MAETKLVYSQPGNTSEWDSLDKAALVAFLGFFEIPILGEDDEHGFLSVDKEHEGFIQDNYNVPQH